MNGKEILPPLICLQEFMECGAVYRCIKGNPDISDSEIAKLTRLLPDKVAALRVYVEHDLGLCRARKESVESPPTFANSALAVDEKVRIKESDCPVKTNLDYTGRIVSMHLDTVGCAFVNGFPCHVPGVKLGELVKFRVTEIKDGFCEALLVRVLQKEIIEQAVSAIGNEEIPEVQEKRRLCIECNSSVSEEDYEVYDGLCMQCWFRALQNEAAKTERRSGILGADRAGSW